MKEVRANMPIVSIGMPIYNEEKYLRGTIESLLAQDVRDIELNISDNCSTDRTPEICAEFAAQDPRVRYFRQPQSVGIVENFNSVVEHARSEYFMWASGHDLWGRAFFRDALSELSADRSAVLCYPRTRWIGPTGDFLRDQSDGIGTGELGTVSRFNTVIWRSVKCNPIHGLIRLSALRKTRLMPKVFGGDLVLLAELACYGRFVELPDPLYMRRVSRPDETLEQQASRLFQTMVLRKRFRKREFPYWEMALEFPRMVLRTHVDLPTKLVLLASLGLCLPTRFGNRMVSELRSAVAGPRDHEAR